MQRRTSARIIIAGLALAGAWGCGEKLETEVHAPPDATVEAKQKADTGVEVKQQADAATEQDCGLCDRPPPAQCHDDISLRVYESQGHCVEAECKYPSRIQTCDDRCIEDACATIPANHPPTVSSATLSPIVGDETTIFRCSAGPSSDADEDPITLSFLWLVNAQASVQTASITGTHFSRGDAIRCLVTANDGQDDGPSASSSTVTIANSIPSIRSVSIGPARPNEADRVTPAIVGWNDHDGDAQNFHYDWRLNGISVSIGTLIDGRLFDRGDRIQLVLTPYDGFDEGMPMESNVLTVINAPGEIASVDLTPHPGRQTSTALLTTSTDDLLASGVDWSDADGDPEGYEYAWLVNSSTVVGQTTPHFSSSHFVRGDRVVARIWPHDGLERSRFVDSNAIIVANTPPAIPCSAPCPSGINWPCTCLNVTITPDHGDRNTRFTCIPSGWTDVDQDPPFYIYQWFVNGNHVGATSQFTPGPLARRDDEIHCASIPFDGFEAGISEASLVLPISNALPTAPTATISPVNPNSAQDLQCAILTAASDADNDMITYSFAWTNGSLQIPGAVLPASNTIPSETWTCSITPHDGFNDGASGLASVDVREQELCGIIFDGNSTYVDMGPLSLNAPLTMEAWVKPNDILATQTIISNKENAGCAIQFNDCDGSIGTSQFCGVYYVDNLRFANSAPITRLDWMHLASVYDGSEIRFYVNGVLQDRSNATGAIVASSVNLLIGAQAQPNVAGGRESYFSGELAEIRISSSIRYTSDFTAAEAFSTDAETLRLWKFDEGHGQIATDASANTQDGTIYNGTWNSHCPP